LLFGADEKGFYHGFGCAKAGKASTAWGEVQKEVLRKNFKTRKFI